MFNTFLRALYFAAILNISFSIYLPAFADEGLAPNPSELWKLELARVESLSKSAPRPANVLRKEDVAELIKSHPEELKWVGEQLDAIAPETGIYPFSDLEKKIKPQTPEQSAALALFFHLRGNAIEPTPRNETLSQISEKFLTQIENSDRKAVHFSAEQIEKFFHPLLDEKTTESIKDGMIPIELLRELLPKINANHHFALAQHLLNYSMHFHPREYFENFLTQAPADLKRRAEAFAKPPEKNSDSLPQEIGKQQLEDPEVRANVPRPQAHPPGASANGGGAAPGAGSSGPGRVSGGSVPPSGHRPNSSGTEAESDNSQPDLSDPQAYAQKAKNFDYAKKGVTLEVHDLDDHSIGTCLATPVSVTQFPKNGPCEYENAVYITADHCNSKGNSPALKLGANLVLAPGKYSWVSKGNEEDSALIVAPRLACGSVTTPVAKICASPLTPANIDQGAAIIQTQMNSSGNQPVELFNLGKSDRVGFQLRDQVTANVIPRPGDSGSPVQIKGADGLMCVASTLSEIYSDGTAHKIDPVTKKYYEGAVAGRVAPVPAWVRTALTPDASGEPKIFGFGTIKTIHVQPDSDPLTHWQNI